jgi:hypothetical protein
MNGGASLGGMGEFKGKGSFNSAERILRDEAKGPLLRMSRVVGPYFNHKTNALTPRDEANRPLLRVSRVVGFVFTNKINALSLRDEAQGPFFGGEWVFKLNSINKTNVLIPRSGRLAASRRGVSTVTRIGV